MKNLKTIGKKIIFIVITLILVSGFIGGTAPSIKANTESTILISNVNLFYENTILRNRYLELEKKLVEFENLTKEINMQNNILYSQILGVDFDTTEFNHYRNDNAKFIFNLNDSIFKLVDDRAFYALEMLALQLEKLQATSHRFKNNKNAILYYPTISPIKTKDFIYLSSPYGWRNHPTEKKTLFHEGVDISANVGTSIYSTAQGTVVKILYSKYGYGNRVIIRHSYGFETLYAHMNIIKVKKGQWVNKNQLIGTVGNTGRSTGSHLHYEIRKNSEPRDPLGYFYTHITNELLAIN